VKKLEDARKLFFRSLMFATVTAAVTATVICQLYGSDFNWQVPVVCAF